MLKKEKSIETPQLRIVGNAMAWGESVIQLSNISSVSTVPLELIPFPLGAVITCLIGMALCSFKTVGWIGVVCIIAGGVYLAYWYQENETIKTQKILIVLMNSGKVFTFIFYDKKFLDQVFKVLSSIIAEKRKEGQNIKINISNSNISGDAKILNDLFISQ